MCKFCQVVEDSEGARRQEWHFWCTRVVVEEGDAAGEETVMRVLGAFERLRFYTTASFDRVANTLCELGRFIEGEAEDERERAFEEGEETGYNEGYETGYEVGKGEAEDNLATFLRDKAASVRTFEERLLIQDVAGEFGLHF